MRAFVLALLLLVAAPAAASAGTASVEPYREPPSTDPNDPGCGKYMQCPADMVVFTAAAGERNDVTITSDSVDIERFRFLVRDAGAPLEAGAGCERVDERTVACTAETIYPVQLGDGDDRIDSSGGVVSGGDGNDVLNVRFGSAEGGEGDDVLIAANGKGGGGDDVLLVNFGLGDAGDDTLRCFPQASACYLRGGSGNDVLTGGTSNDQLFGERGRDLLRGRSGNDNLSGGLGNDRLLGGAGADVLGGGPGTDRVNCGTGRRDRAVTDRRDRVSRCERVTARRGRAG